VQLTSQDSSDRLIHYRLDESALEILVMTFPYEQHHPGRDLLVAKGPFPRAQKGSGSNWKPFGLPVLSRREKFSRIHILWIKATCGFQECMQSSPFG